ncbi:MAG: hypothetical protein WA060_01495 [Minisyncoccia bacterium]
MNYKFSNFFVLFVLIIGSFLFVNNIVSAQTSCQGVALREAVWVPDHSYAYQACGTAITNCSSGQQCVPNTGRDENSINTKIGPSGEEPSLGSSVYCGKRATCVTPSFDVTTSKTGDLASTATVTPNLKTVSSGSTASFTLSPGFSTQVVGCSLGSFSGNVYTTGPISGNCNVQFNFPAPPLSCAVDTAATPAPHLINNTVKFLATGGTGTWSWTNTDGGTPSTGTGNQIWPAWSTTGTKTVTVTSGTQTKTCTVNITNPPTPPLSCAHDTNQAEPIYTGAGAKFRATGGTGTYSWTYSATPSAGNPTSGIEVWPAWTNSGTKTATVTSGSLTANCTVYITPLPATPINGVCATTHYACGSPAASTNNSSLNPSLWTWTCPGSNGGTNASCSELKPAMNGTLNATNCIINGNASSCTSTVTWSTVSPVGTSNVTSNTPSANTVIGTGISGSTTAIISYNSRNFYLNNNGVQLASDIATATCATGTSWNGSICAVVAVVGPDLTASAPVPGLATVNVPRTFSANISNIGSSSTAVSFQNQFQVASLANGGGTITNLTPTVPTTALGGGVARDITSPPHTFTAIGTQSIRVCADIPPQPNGVVVEANESNNCSPWTNVTVDTTVCTITGYHDAASGTVPASQCQANGWAACSNDKALDLNIRVLSDGVQVTTGTAGTYRGDLEAAGVCTGGTCSYWTNLSGLITPGVNHTITAQAQNPGNGVWTTLTSSPRIINCGAPTTGTLTASDCTIAQNASSCSSTVGWSTTNPVGTSNVTSNTPTPNFLIANGNSGALSVTVPYNSRTFFLNNNSVTIATDTANATCVSGTVWDGSKCYAAPPSVCGNGVREGAESCDLGGGNGACPSLCSTSCTINSCAVPTNGSCGTPAAHYNCASPQPSINQVNGISSWTWTCPGADGGASVSCEELKKKPIIIED